MGQILRGIVRVQLPTQCQVCASAELHWIPCHYAHFTHSRAARLSEVPVSHMCLSIKEQVVLIKSTTDEMYTSSTSFPIGALSSGTRVPSSFRKALCGGLKTDALSISICRRVSSWKVLRLMRRHTAMELRDMSRQRATGKPGNHRWTADLGAQWHTGLLSPADSLAVSILLQGWKMAKQLVFFFVLPCELIAISLCGLTKQRC